MAFEEYAILCFYDVSKDANGEYTSRDTYIASLIWQASRNAAIDECADILEIKADQFSYDGCVEDECAYNNAAIEIQQLKDK